MAQEGATMQSRGLWPHDATQRAKRKATSNAKLTYQA